MKPFDLPLPTSILPSKTNIRPQKRQRIEVLLDDAGNQLKVTGGDGRTSAGTSPQGSGVGVAPVPTTTPTARKRAPTACDNCRSRKTKCDNGKPACGSCVRTGIECCYSGSEEKELSLYESTSLRILDGIDRLEKLLKHSVAQQPRSVVPSPLLSTATNITHTAASTPAATVIEREDIIIDGFDADRSAGTGVLPVTELRVPSRLDSVLAWSVFPQDHPSPSLNPSDRRPVTTSSGSSSSQPNILAAKTILQMHSLYLTQVHPSHPIIDLVVLESALLDVEKNGVGWNLYSCLIMLTCALGTISEDYKDYIHTSSPEALQQSRSPQREMALQYWHMAQKRLGVAMGEDSELAAQCLCLSGFWHLYNLEPITAYKIFHTACVTWQTLHIVAPSENSDLRDGTSMTYEQYLKQRLYWTCLKAECELRAELSLPVPTGSQMEYPLHFPAPPTSFEPQHYTDVESQSWYFYTAEIFLRRLHNRIVNEVSSFETDLDNPATTSKALNQQRLSSLITITREFEAYVSRWQSSLPPSIHFPNPFPPVNINPLEDEFQQHLRNRFIECHELLYRPYINLALNHLPWVHSLPDPHLQWEVSRFSSLALTYCVYNLSTDRNVMYHRSPGVWFDCRARLCDTLILRAAAKHGFQLQMGWEEAVERADRALKFWAEGGERSGLGQCWEVARWARDRLGNRSIGG